jgi:hypothetical protein
MGANTGILVMKAVVLSVDETRGQYTLSTKMLEKTSGIMTRDPQKV